jgi:hypothetical protein
MVEDATPAEHRRLGDAARDLAKRATGALEFDLRPTLRKATVRNGKVAEWAGSLEAGGRQ